VARTARRPAGTRHAAVCAFLAATLCAGCAGHGASVSPDAPAASRQLPGVQPGQQEPITGFIAGPEGPQVSVPASYLFSLDSAVIRPAAVAGLRKLLPAIRGSSGAVMVYGYTDGLGTIAHNKLLSRERADAVAQWLISNHIDPRRVHPEGKGEATSAIDPAQRRVEIVLK
jgi:outer membrane protein OmpA-like peptidoglycan-associated protein